MSGFFKCLVSLLSLYLTQVLIPVLLMLKKDKHGIVNKNLSFIFLNKTVKFTFIIIGYSKVCSARLNF